MDRHPVFIALTVLLETEWVFRSAYQFPKDRIVTALRAFSVLPTVTLEDRSRAEAALDLALVGLDFADALHLSATDHCDAFLTFDLQLAKSGGAAGLSIRSP